MTKPVRILSLCPDPTLGETRRLLLENAGYEVVAVQNRHEAILACGSRRFDLAVLCHLIDVKEAVMIAKDIGAGDDSRLTNLWIAATLLEP